MIKQFISWLDLDALKTYLSKTCFWCTTHYQYPRYHEFIPITELLDDADYYRNWCQHSDHLNIINKVRIEWNLTHTDKLPLRSEFKDHYDNRTGYYIDGSKIITRLHPLHDKQLVCNKTGKRYVIDTVQISHWFGNYMTIGMREEGSKSHKHILFENYTCREPDIVKEIKKNKKQYQIVDKTYFKEY